MKRILFAGAALALLVFAPAPAQQISRTPLMQGPRDELPIQLQSLQASVQLRGGLAETTLRMAFYNPNPRPLEGNLQFPLLDGQQVTGFALDFDGRLRPAVPVRKAQGQQVFQKIERRNVDPALLEKTQGNNFRLRVYPVPAKGIRLVELRYSEALASTGAQRRYRLPLDYAGKLRDFGLEIDTDAPGKPVANGVIGGLEFQRKGGMFHAQLTRLAFAPSGTLEVLVPTPKLAQVSIQALDDSLYFVAELPAPSSQAANALARSPRAIPHRVGLLWDSSMSGEGRAHGAEFELLDRYFHALGDGEVLLQRLRDRAEPVQSFPIHGGDWSALRHELEGTVYDGASALADWRPQPGVGEYLLFSDGLLNYGPALFPAMGDGQQRLFAINSSASADRERLRAVVQASGGTLVELDSRHVDAGARQLLEAGMPVSSSSTQGIADLERAPGDASDGFIRYAGRLTSPQGRLELRFADGSSSQVVITDQSPINPFAARQWANYRLATLAASPELKRAEIERLGTRFGIATNETSLIVLDRVEDYVDNDIAPPPELAQEYDRLRGERDLAKAQGLGAHLDQVAEEFSERVAWWHKEFPKDDPRANLPADGKHTTSLDSAPAMAEPAFAPTPSPAAAPPPPPPPPAPAPPEIVAGGSVEDDSEPAALPAPAAVRSEAAGTASKAATIAIKGWQADAPYMPRLRSAKPADTYAIYLDERPTWRNSSGFYVDVADLLLERGQKDLALRVLSNLAEMDLDNRQVLRVLGYRLMQAREAALAVPVFERVRALAEYEPQSWRDLGNAYAAAGRAQDAIDALYEVVSRDWDDQRFAEIELVALAELNALAAANPKLDTSRVDERLRANLPLDLRVVLSWDVDNSDMDLWVTDPNGEKCFYSNRNTYQGGHLTDDFTGGYGPEEFSLRVAKKGRYRVEVNYFGDREQVAAGPATLQLHFLTKFGTPAVRDQAVMLRLDQTKETALVGEFVVD